MSVTGHLGNLISLDIVLEDDRTSYEPWKRENFLKFLQKEKNDENFFFYEEVLAYKAVLNNKVDEVPPDRFLFLPSISRKDPVQLEKTIIDTFVKDDAPLQVNISDDQRRKVESGIIPEGKKTIFDEAQKEVKLLMLNDSWPRFVRKALTQNIGTNDRRNRLIIGFTFLFIYALAFGFLLGFFVYRFYFFLLLIPLLAAFDYLVPAYYRLCPILARKGLTGDDNVVIVCEITKQNNRKTAQKVKILAIIIPLLLGGLSFAITYIIDAAVGSTLYG